MIIMLYCIDDGQEFRMQAFYEKHPISKKSWR